MRAYGRFRPLPLVLARIGQFWAEVWRSWRLTLDWTVILYLALPGLFVFANMYRDAWQHPPGWFDLVRPQLVFAALGALMLRSRLRTFADPGDGLFLRRNARWTRTLLAAGFAYTLAARLLTAAAALGLLVPVLSIRLHWTMDEGLFTGLAAALLGFVWSLARDRLERRWTGWSRLAALWLARAAMMAGWVALMSAAADAAAMRQAALALLAVAAAWLAWRRAKARGTFLQELAAESEAYMASVRLLLRYSVGIRSAPSGKRPLLALRRRRLFRRRDLPGRIAELGVKAGLRESGSLSTLAQLSVFAAAALALTPLWLGTLVWPALGLLALLWLHGQWRQWEDEGYVAMLPWSEEALRQAEPLYRIRFLAPMFGFWGLVLGVKAGLAYGGWGWLAAAGYLALGWLAARGLNAVTTRVLNRRRARDRGRNKHSQGQADRLQSE